VSGLWDDVQPEASRRLLLAAVEAFAQRGYHATTTREIASRAGMSPAGVYVHYETKAALLYAISRTGHQAALAAVEQAVADEGAPAGWVSAFVTAFTAWHARNHTAARVIQYELGALTGEQFAEIRRLRSRFERLLGAEIRRGAAAGAFATPDARTAVRAILSLGIDVARWYRAAADPAPDRLGSAYAQLALVMLRPTA